MPVYQPARQQVADELFTGQPGIDVSHQRITWHATRSILYIDI